MEMLGLKGYDYIMDTDTSKIIDDYKKNGSRFEYLLKGLKLDWEHLKYSPVLTPSELESAEKKYAEVIAELEK